MQKWFLTKLIKQGDNRLKQIAEYQLLIMNEKDFMKALKKLNDKIYIENQNTKKQNS